VVPPPKQSAKTNAPATACDRFMITILWEIRLTRGASGLYAYTQKWTVVSTMKWPHGRARSHFIAGKIGLF